MQPQCHGNTAGEQAKKLRLRLPQDKAKEKEKKLQQNKPIHKETDQLLFFLMTISTAPNPKPSQPHTTYFPKKQKRD